MLSPVPEKIVDVIALCAGARDREPLWDGVLAALRDYSKAAGAELSSSTPNRILAVDGDVQAPDVEDVTLVASGRRRGALKLWYAEPGHMVAWPPGVLALLGMILADEANIWEMRKIVEGAAHDLRGAFVRLNTFFQLAQVSSPAPAEPDEIAAFMKQDLASLDLLLRDLHAFVAPRGNAMPGCSIRVAWQGAEWNLKRELEQKPVAVAWAGSDARVRMSEDDLAAVFARILSNTLKFAGNAPSMTVSIGEADGAVAVDVWDDGPGVEAEYRERIFEPFQRLHGKQFPGHGLGLTICRRKVEEAGGELWAESAPSSGLQLRMRLPRA